jgi:multiple sugar transport system ATP-binding protein
MTIIQLRNVNVILRTTSGGRNLDVRALDDASLTVRSGEVMGVIGPTGCGKSTLLRVIAGLVAPTSGTVLFDGVDQRHVLAQQRNIGMVFQDFALYTHWNVLDNLSFFHKLRKREAEVPEKVQQAADILGVNFDLLMGRMPKKLSVGQRQQVAIARCLVRDPNIFLMDEPFSSLDAMQRQHARVQLKRLLHRFRVTTLYVTHDQLEAAALVDRVAFMDAGHVWQVDSYKNLLAWPANLRVAAFVAEPGSQFVDGVFEDGAFVCPAFRLPVMPAVAVRATPGAPLVLRAPPAAVMLAGEAEPDWPQALAQVEWIEPLPMQRAQRVICHNGPVVLAAELAQEKPVRVGEMLRLQIDPDRVQVFDGPSGVNLALAAPR